MSDPADAIQTALYAALAAMSGAHSGRVYDHVPTAPAFPYITIGPATSVPVDLDCYAMTETTLQVDVWSRDVGFPQAKILAGAIRDLLHGGELTLTGHYVHLQRIESITYERDPDELTSRARIQLRLETQAAD